MIEGCGSKHDPKNYRPVSLTSIVVKIMERLVHGKITNFLNKHNKLDPFQHGFRSGHSCQTQLLETVHQCTNTLDRRSSSHVLFLDFSKAFDRVPHKRLLLKLDCIGVSSGVAKVGHTGARALATRGCAPPVQALLKIIGAECTVINRELGAKSAQRC